MNLDLFSFPPTNGGVAAVAASTTLPDSAWCEPVLTDALSNRKVDVKTLRADALSLAQVHEAIGIVAAAKGEAYRLAQAGKPVARTSEQAARITAAIGFLNHRFIDLGGIPLWPEMDVSPAMGA